MIEVTLSASAAQSLQQHLLATDEESCSILLATPVRRADGLTRLLVRETIEPNSEDYQARGRVEAVLTPAFVNAAAKRAALKGYALIFVHSHPGAAPPAFSRADDAGEVALAAYLRMRWPGQLAAAIVVSAGGWACRELGGTEPSRLVALGEERTVLAGPKQDAFFVDARFDRQARAFGAEGQAAISGLRVAIVGLGGTGSLIAEQLAHLGVRDFILIDRDRLEATNLNRVVGATPADVGRSKVALAARLIKAISPKAACEQVEGNIVHSRIARHLTNADIIFGCTDSHGSRAVLQQICYQYLIACIDMGTTIAVADGRVEAIVGRAQLLAPDMACFTCSGLLDTNQVRRDMMDEAERKLDPYMPGHIEPAPAVISLNATVASLAVTMFMAVVAHWPSTGRFLLYNALASSLRRAIVPPLSNCYCCSSKGFYARGDTVDLAARQD